MKSSFDVLAKLPYDTTLHRIDWRSHHWGYSLAATILLSRIFAPLIAIATVQILFMIYKLFFEHAIADKAGMKDFVADYCDYAINWMCLPMVWWVYLIVTGVIIGLHFATTEWSTP